MSKKNLILLGFILIKFILQYIAIDSGYDLHRDEYMHLDLGNHLAWGYSSVPPVTGFISLIIQLMGKSVFWVKFFPALFGALTLFVTWKIVEELKGGLFALVLASTSILFSVLIRINILYQPNSLDFLMWTTLFYTLLKFVNTEKNKWLYYSALAFAVGFLNKYNMGFMLMGLLPAIVLSRHRKVFLNKHLYIAAALAFVLILPNLIWQVRNGFPVFHHMRTLAQTQLVHVDRLNFLIEQTYFFAGSLLVIILAFVAFFRHEAFRNYRFFFFTYLFTMALFLYFKAKSYYSIGLYPMLLAFGAVYTERLLKKGWLLYLRIPVILGPVIYIILLFRLLLPVLTPEQIRNERESFERFGLLRWEDGQNHHMPQDFADMLGWKELASLVDSAFLQIEDKERTLIYCDNYGEAGAINYYSEQQYTEAVARHDDYLNWFPLDKFEIQNAILVREPGDEKHEIERGKTLFEEVICIGQIKNENAREKGTSVYLLMGPKQSINKIIAEEIAERRH